MRLIILAKPSSPGKRTPLRLTDNRPQDPFFENISPR